MKFPRLLTPVGLLVVCVACAKVAPPPAESEGPARFQMQSFFSDTRASRVGDLLTVHIVESAKGRRSSTSKVNKESETSMGATSRSASINNAISAGLESTNEFDSESTFQRQGVLEARITVVVVEVLPNGNLVVEGTQDISIGPGLQTISVRGIVRPQDILSDNSVISTKLANSKIRYKTKKEPGSHRFGLVGWLFNLVF